MRLIFRLTPVEVDKVYIKWIVMLTETEDVEFFEEIRQEIALDFQKQFGGQKIY